MPDVFDRIAGRHSGTIAPGTRLTMRPKQRFAEVTAAEEPAGPLGADAGADGGEAGVRTLERPHGDLRPRRSAEHGETAPPTPPTTRGEDRRGGPVPDATRPPGPPSRDRRPAAPPAPRGLPDRPATVPRLRAPSPPATAVPHDTPGEPSLGDKPRGAAPQTGLQPAPTTAAAVQVPEPPSPRTSPRHPAGPARTVEPEELLREHLAPALAARGIASAPAVERLAAVGLQAVEVPSGGDVHVHIGRVELHQPGPPPRPAAEQPRADDRPGSGRVDHADYLARQRRRWS